MRKTIAAAVIGLMALTGQAVAKETVKAAPVSRAAPAAANANQLMGLGLIPTLIIAAAGITLIALIADNNKDKGKST